MIAVLGPGGVGGLLAAALAHADRDVVVVAREETAQALSRDGLHVHSVTLGDFHVAVRAVPRLAEDVDVLIVATKARGLDDALARIEGEPSLVVPLLNGFEHLEGLRERFGERVVAATIRVEADRPRTGEIVHTSRFLRVEMAGSEDRLAGFAADLRAAGVEVVVRESEAQVMWSKLVRLCALATTTTASGMALGEIRADPLWRGRLEAIVRECAAVAATAGASVDPSQVMAELDAAHATLTSSMSRDRQAGRPTELDAIAGAVLRAGAAGGVECPVLEEVVSLIN